MTDHPATESELQSAPARPAASETAVQEMPATSDVIPLPPLPPAPAAPSSVAVGWSVFDVVLLLLVATLAFFLGSFVANNSDFWQHLATGRGIAQGTQQFGVDPYSFASVRNGTLVLWVNHSWLYDLSLYGLYNAVHERGVVIVHALLLVALLVTFLRMCPRDSNRLIALLIAGLTVIVISQRVPLNSLMVSYLLLGVLLLLLWRGGALGGLATDDEAAPRALWGVPLLFALWVNLDAWFILGLVLLGLIVLGNALGSLMRWPSRCRLTTQAVVFLASVAACCLNPFHIHAFTLPTELAFVLGDWLPAPLGDGGEALRGLLLHEPEMLTGGGWVGSFHFLYLRTLTIANVAYYGLLLASAASFVLHAWNARRADGPGLSFARLLAWGAVVVLSVLQIRLIPFFAVVAGPMAVLNFADFARGWRRRPDGTEAPAFSPGLARLVVTVLVLIALGLAWPGWLHIRSLDSRSLDYSARRVAWQVQEDPSLRAAAEALAQDQAQHVFNFSPDLAHYCAWFAPGVRCYVDHRLPLFAKEAARYAEAKKELRTDAFEVVQNQRLLASAWRDTFRHHQIDHVAVTRFMEDPQQRFVIQMCWLQPWHWSQRFADGPTVIFSWSAAGQAHAIDLLTVWNREAFGPVPEARQAPRKVENLSQGGRALSEMYLEGQAALTPRGATEPFIHLLYFDLVKNRWRLGQRSAWQVVSWAAPSGLGGAVPGSVLGLSALLAPISSPLPQMVSVRDTGPPAAPLLMIREARRVLHEHPFEPRAHLALYQAYVAQALELEAAWSARPNQPAITNARVSLRQMQMATALRNYLDLRPDDWRTRLEFAQLLRRHHHLDAGLEQLTLVQQGLEKERRTVRDKREQEAIKIDAKKVAEFIQFVEREVTRRRNDYALKTAKLDPMQKFRRAVQLPYQTVNDANREVADERGMGLSLEGLKQLQSIPPESLKGEVQTELHFNRFRLLMQLGRLGEAIDEAKELLALAQGAQVFEFLLWHNAALGDYDGMEAALANRDEATERVMPLAAQQASLRIYVVAYVSLNPWSQLPQLARFYAGLLPAGHLTQYISIYRQSTSIRADWRTLRGIFALEAGDTAQAETHFAEALRIGGPDVQFVDRPIAERYLELLRGQKRK